MTTLKINMKAFAEVAASIRGDLGCFNSDEESIYSFYRWFVQDAADKIHAAPVDPRSYSAIHDELSFAARAAGFMGASDRQVDYLTKLAFEAGNWTGLSGGMLKKGEASIMIDEYLAR